MHKQTMDISKWHSELSLLWPSPRERQVLSEPRDLGNKTNPFLFMVTASSCLYVAEIFIAAIECCLPENQAEFVAYRHTLGLKVSL